MSKTKHGIFRSISVINNESEPFETDGKQESPDSMNDAAEKNM